MSNDRITRHEMLAEIASIVAKRSTCPRKSVGAIIAREGRVLSMGYNGAPSGLPHCLSDGCIEGPDGGCIRTQHAEANAIAFAARVGIKVEGADLWTTVSPCLSCAKVIINAGIKSVYYLNPYRDTSGIDLLNQAGINTARYVESEQQPSEYGCRVIGPCQTPRCPDCHDE